MMFILHSRLEDYLTMRRALGFKLVTDGFGLKSFVSFMEQQQRDFITVELALAWAQRTTSDRPGQCARRLTFVRGFARYCSAIDARTQVPPSDLVPHSHFRPRPYFFTDDDIGNLLKVTLELSPEDGLRRWTFHCLFGLMSVSGLRISEALGLTLDDVDLDEAILTIRSSKFGKSRLVPLHGSTAGVLASYLQRRQHSFPAHPGSPVFVDERGMPLGHDQALNTFQRLAKTIGLGPQGDRMRLRLHDLRHRFALKTLLQWYQDGKDVELRLPVLSAYLGHAEVSDTYWYLSACPEIFKLAQERLEQYWGQE